MKKNPYSVIKHIHVTEKSAMLQALKSSESNKCVRSCLSPKYVFIVDKDANKTEIAQALEEIYSEKNIKVVAVNTINVKGKRTRYRGRPGTTSSFKKAIVTLEVADSLDEFN